MTSLPVFVSPGAAPAAAISAVAADGWQSTMVTPADLALSPVAVSRQGFDATGTAATIADTIYTGKQVRGVYPDHATLTSNYGLTDYVFAGDTISGVTNNSTLVSPKPFAAWIMPSRLTVGDTIHWEVKAYHYTGIACVWVRANDGTTATAWQVVASQTLSSAYEDAHPVAAFIGDLDVSGLADGVQARLEAKVFPRFGAAILDSEVNNTAGVNRREFTRRYFRRDTVRAAAFYRVYVASTGNDSTGVASTNDATAAASPCLTLAGAWAKLRAAAPTRGSMDNAHVYVVDAVSGGAVTFNTYYQDIGALIVTRAAGSTRANAKVTLGASFRSYFTDHATVGDEGALVFTDMTLKVGEFYLQGEAGSKLFVQFVNTALDMGATTVTSLRSNSHLAFFGCTIASTAAMKAVQQSGAGQIRCLRGVTADLANGNYEGWVTVGCKLTRVNSPAFTDVSKDGHIWAECSFPNPDSTNVPIAMAGPNGSTAFDLGAFFIGNIEIERLSGSSVNIGVAHDGRTGNIVHGIITHATTPGTGIAGRWNLAYDENQGVARQHKLLRVIGNIGPQMNTKSDVFVAVNQSNPTEAANRTGNFALIHGVGVEGNFWRHYDASAGNTVTGPGSQAFGPAWHGRGSSVGGDPLYVDNKAVYGTPPTVTTGSGGGDYHLVAGSPARGVVSASPVPFDLDGNARSGPVTAGGYA